MIEFVDPQAAILLPKLEILDEEIELRQQVAARCDRLLNEAGIETTPYSADAQVSIVERFRD